METINNLIGSFDSTLVDFRTHFFEGNTLLYGIMFLFITLYSAQIAPNLPPMASKIFANNYFKLFAFILILWIAQISPSMSILIAVAFLMTTNYMYNQQIWENLGNTQSVTGIPTSGLPSPVDSVNAVNQLTIQAMTPNPGVWGKVQNAMNVAATNVSNADNDTLQAIQALGEQAMAATAGDTSYVQGAMNTAINGINSNLSASATPDNAMQAVQTLANSAASSSPDTNATILTAANTVAVNVAPGNANAIAALNNLVNAAATPAPINVSAITANAQVVAGAIGTPNWAKPPAGMFDSVTGISTGAAAAPAWNGNECYPIRHADMSQVHPSIDGNSIESYQMFDTSLSGFAPTAMPVQPARLMQPMATSVPSGSAMVMVPKHKKSKYTGGVTKIPNKVMAPGTY